MKILASLILLLLTSAFGAVLEDISISSDRNIQVLLMLDSKFSGRVVRQDTPTFLNLTLKGLKYNKNRVSTTTKLIKNIEIFAKGDDTYIVFDGDNIGLEYDLEVLNSSSAIKIVLKPKDSVFSNMLSTPNNANDAKTLEEAISSLKSQDSTTIPQIDTWRYALVVSILIALIIALILAKRRVFKKHESFEFSYFKRPSVSVTQSVNLDMKNKIIVLDSKEYSYILFIGQSGAFMLDKIPKMREQDIKELLEKKENKISYLLKAYDEKHER